MATKLMVPRPKSAVKVQPKEISLDASDVVEDADNTEPSAAPPVEIVEVSEVEVVEVARVEPPKPVPLQGLPGVVVLPGILIGPTPTPLPAREPVFSLPSQYELESERKSSPPIAQRRKELMKYVASAVGVAWFICTCAIGETALRSLIASMH
jgi:hypothetical protein